MADRDTLGPFLGLPVEALPEDPEAVVNPARHLVELARESSNPLVREYLPPRPGSGGKVGPGYNNLMIQYVWRAWRPPLAESRAASLARLGRSLARLARSWPGQPAADAADDEF